MLRSSQFISSTHYAYVLSLKAKELTFLSVGHFKVQRLLGEGGFGQVLEVVKRDCGKRYAMKVMAKDKVMATLGEDNWEELVLPLFLFASFPRFMLCVFVCNVGDVLRLLAVCTCMLLAVDVAVGAGVDVRVRGCLWSR